jgi:hypothetical protein
LAECAQDAEDCDVSGENAKSDGSDDGEAEDKGHQVRDHDLNPSIFWQTQGVLS